MLAEQERQETLQARKAMQEKLLSIAAGMSTTAKRQQLAADVFKSSHILPTMTIEQAGLIELQQVRCCRMQLHCDLLRMPALLHCERKTEQRVICHSHRQVMEAAGLSSCMLLVNRSSHAVKLLQAQERQQREAANAARQAREEAEKSEDQKEEEAVQKARAWDDFKDDHPTGYGNSKLRPCAL